MAIRTPLLRNLCTYEDSWVARSIVTRDPDDCDDYLDPQPLYKLRSRHKSIYRCRAKSKPYGIPPEFQRKRVRFVMSEEEERDMGTCWLKSGWSFPNIINGKNLEYTRLKAVPWERRLFTPKYIVFCWMEQYRENPSDFVWRNFLSWYNLGKGWGWDEPYFLDEARRVIVVPVERCLPP